jgi:hypothetical protein
MPEVAASFGFGELWPDFAGAVSSTTPGCAHEGLAYFEAHASGWLTLAMIAGTVLCAWVGVGQISLFAHAWKWFRST